MGEAPEEDEAADKEVEEKRCRLCSGAVANSTRKSSARRARPWSRPTAAMDTLLSGISSLLWTTFTSLPSLPSSSSSEEQPADAELDPAAHVSLKHSRLVQPPLDAAHARRPRLLCLHGRGSNNDITRFQMVHTRLCEYADCDLLHAPLDDDAYSSDFHLLSALPFHAWWHGTLDGQRLAHVLRLVLRYVERHGPYDGLYGFSQGAALVSLISRPGMIDALGGCAVRPWSFVILGCGVHLGDEAAAALCATAPIALPSLHLIGRWDLLCRTGSERLAEQYTAPTVYTHDWGHSLPAGLMADAECAATVRTFIMAQQQAALVALGDADDDVSARVDLGAPGTS